MIRGLFRTQYLTNCWQRLAAEYHAATQTALSGVAVVVVLMHHTIAIYQSRILLLVFVLSLTLPLLLSTPLFTQTSSLHHLHHIFCCHICKRRLEGGGVGWGVILHKGKTTCPSVGAVYNHGIDNTIVKKLHRLI